MTARDPTRPARPPWSHLPAHQDLEESTDPDPDREAKLDRIEHVLDRFPDRVFAFDEFGPLGIRPPQAWAGPNGNTPSYASWANPIEAHFGPLRQFTIASSNHPNHPVQTRTLHAYLRWRNATARHRDVLAAERRERARIRSEKGIRWGGRPLNTPA